jgi:hypothetical protein
VKFEVDFPLEVLGDYRKFQQIFINCLLKVLGILRERTIDIECKLAEIDINNKFMIHINIRLPNIKHKGVSITKFLNKTIECPQDLIVMKNIFKMDLLDLGSIFIIPLAK